MRPEIVRSSRTDGDEERSAPEESKEKVYQHVPETKAGVFALLITES